MKYNVIFCADDYGVNPYRTAGILHAFRHGVITCASFLVNGQYPEQAIAWAQATDLGKKLGLHVNLTEGKPISGVDKVSSLVQSNGRFLGKVQFFEKLMAGLLSLEEVKVEIQAQFERFYQLTGYYPNHADGHHHIHVFTPLTQVFQGIFLQNTVTSTRIPYDEIYVTTLPQGYHYSSIQGEERWNGIPFYTRVCDEAKQANVTYRQAGIRTTDHYIGLVTMGQGLTVDRLHTFLTASSLTRDQGRESVGVETVEIMTHPGWCPPPSLSASHLGQADLPENIPCDDEFWYCYFTKSEDRVHELTVVTNPELFSLFQSFKALKASSTLSQSTSNKRFTNHNNNKLTLCDWSAV